MPHFAQHRSPAHENKALRIGTSRWGLGVWPPGRFGDQSWRCQGLAGQRALAAGGPAVHSPRCWSAAAGAEPPDWAPDYSEGSSATALELLQFPRATPTAGWTAQGAREPPNRINHAGWSCGNYLVLRAISRRITGHPDGSLKGQMAWTGETERRAWPRDAGCRVNALLSFDALHAGIRNPRSTGRQSRGSILPIFFFFPFRCSLFCFRAISISTAAAFVDSPSPSRCRCLPACLRRICWPFGCLSACHTAPSPGLQFPLILLSLPD
ncbi:hypothetical protein GGI43DRAFT_269711 [Trichoderma evansii]